MKTTHSSREWKAGDVVTRHGADEQIILSIEGQENYESKFLAAKAEGMDDDDAETHAMN